MVSTDYTIQCDEKSRVLNNEGTEMLTYFKWTSYEKFNNIRGLLQKLESEYMEELLEERLRVLGGDFSCYESGPLEIAIENCHYIERMADAFDRKRNIISETSEGYELMWFDTETARLSYKSITLDDLVSHGRDWFRELLETALDTNLGTEED